MPFIPHTSDDLSAMLKRIGADTLDDLFDEIPANLTMQSIQGAPEGMSESEISSLMHERADTDGRPVCFMGAGAYDHFVPAAVWQLTTRGEFYSASIREKSESTRAYQALEEIGIKPNLWYQLKVRNIDQQEVVHVENNEVHEDEH